MQGATHRRFAPIFALGGGILAMRSGFLAFEGLPDAVKLALIVISSTFTSMAPDADLHCYKPYDVIISGKGRGRYRGVNKRQLRVWAVIFKTMGVKGHRTFKSHSPTLWIPLWVGFYLLFSRLIFPLLGIDLYFAGIIQCVIFGMALGFMSHLVGDMFTKSGIPVLPKKNLAPTAEVGLGNVTKASNNLWNYLFLFIGFEVLCFIVDPHKAMQVNMEAVKLVFTLVPTLVGYIFDLFSMFRG